jgi:hypothetical protein
LSSVGDSSHAFVIAHMPCVWHAFHLICIHSFISLDMHSFFHFWHTTYILRRGEVAGIAGHADGPGHKARMVLPLGLGLLLSSCWLTSL